MKYSILELSAIWNLTFSMFIIFAMDYNNDDYQLTAL